jgi:regulator of nucleoside diphosphate kinase
LIDQISNQSIQGLAMSLHEPVARGTREPTMMLDAAYVAQLEALAVAATDRAPDVADRLQDDLERAIVLPSLEMPSGVVNIGSEVVCRDEASGREQTLVLVLPIAADISAGRVSVVTPMGAALIGLSEGSCVTWATRDGAARRLRIVRVRRVELP